MCSNQKLSADVMLLKHISFRMTFIYIHHPVYYFKSHYIVLLLRLFSKFYMKETLNWNFSSYKLCICAWIKYSFKNILIIVFIQGKLHLFLFMFLEDLLLYIIPQQIPGIKLIENETLIKIQGRWMKQKILLI